MTASPEGSAYNRKKMEKLEQLSGDLDFKPDFEKYPEYGVPIGNSGWYDFMDQIESAFTKPEDTTSPTGQEPDQPHHPDAP
jgi:hypothetical protein